MKMLLNIAVVLSLCTANAAPPVDHLEPVQGTLFDYSFVHDKMLRVRKHLFDSGDRKQVKIIKVVSIVGYPVPRIDLVQLALDGDLNDPDNAKYTVVYREILNP